MTPVDLTPVDMAADVLVVKVKSTPVHGVRNTYMEECAQKV